MNNTSSGWATFGKLLAKTVLSFFYSIYGGWVIMVLWGWFAVGILHLAPITIIMAIAMRIVIGMLKIESGTIKHMMQMDKIAKLDSVQEGFFDWFGQPFIDTMLLFGGAMWHFLLIPAMTLMGF